MTFLGKRSEKHTAGSSIVTPKTVDQYRQNDVKHIVRDLEQYGVPPENALRILMARGVFKWFGARRDIIRRKNELRAKITETIEEIRTMKRRISRCWSMKHQFFLQAPETFFSDAEQLRRFNRATEMALRKRVQSLYRLRGRLEVYVEELQELRGICHSKRWRPQGKDDRSFRELMKSYRNKSVERERDEKAVELLNRVLDDVNQPTVDDCGPRYYDEDDFLTFTQT